MSLGVKVNRIFGEQCRKFLVEAKAFDRGHKIRSDESYVYLPVRPLDEQEMSRLGAISDFELIEMDFSVEKRNLCPEDYLGFRPSFEVVGDIAIVEDDRADEVAESLMSCHKSIKTVIAPVSDVEGEFRTRRFRHVAGEKRTFTTHKEHGLLYRVDLEGAYFTSHLVTERLRIAEQIRPSDVVLDMFAGVGPFAMLAAKRGAKVIAIDKNPVAIKYLQENARLNRIQDILILEGDANLLAMRYENMADHVIMNLPHSADQFLASAIKAARNGGVIHYYAFAPAQGLYRDVDLIKKASDDLCSAVDIVYQGIVRSYSPRKYNITIDFKVRKPANCRQ
jgi:tRNA (guanine37-N1)-methyltransferase